MNRARFVENELAQLFVSTIRLAIGHSPSFLIRVAVTAFHIAIDHRVLVRHYGDLPLPEASLREFVEELNTLIRDKVVYGIDIADRVPTEEFEFEMGRTFVRLISAAGSAPENFNWEALIDIVAEKFRHMLNSLSDISIYRAIDLEKLGISESRVVMNRLIAGGYRTLVDYLRDLERLFIDPPLRQSHANI